MAEIGHAQEISDTLRQRLRQTDSKARVTQVIDGETVVVNNRTTLHLPMIYIPQSAEGSNSKAIAAAKAYLDETLQGKFVSIFQVRNKPLAQTNALGHTEAYLLTDEGVFVQQDMIEKGLAFAYPTPSHKDLADIMLAAEDKARKDKAGLWASDEWKMLSAAQVESGHIRDRFAIVEGRVDKVGSSQNVIFLNFGEDWRKDFTAGVASSLRRDFSKAGKSPMELGGQYVRVRGWIRDYNGPYIELTDSNQIEIIDALTVESDEGTEKEKAWGLESLMTNDIAPKSPLAGEAGGINRPYAAQPLKPVVPTTPLTKSPDTPTPATQLPYEAQKAYKSSVDLMDRGLLEEPAGPEEGNKSKEDQE